MSELTWGPVMLDLAGPRMQPADRDRLSHPMTGGVILFARNFESRAQLRDLTEEIHGLRSDLIVAVDHEGGRVQRFRSDGFTHLPAMRELGQMWDRDSQFGAMAATTAATATGYVMASELIHCGVSLSFAPVLDLDYGPSTVIGDRAFHRDARVVALLGKSLMHGMLLAGMANCAKHFPGHGFVSADSHLALPFDDRAFEDLLREDLRPYDWLSPVVKAVMPAHVVYSSVDDLPAGFSKRWLKDILRERLGFSGAILSDDLSMEGARAMGPSGTNAQTAIAAGCDMVLICNAPEHADEILESLTARASGESARRLAALKPATSTLAYNLDHDPCYARMHAHLVSHDLVR